MIRPTSWIAAIRSTRTSPVSTSTATSATWTPKVSTRIPAGFGPRAPLPRIWPSSSRPVTSSSGHEPPSAETMLPPSQREHALLDVVALRGDLEDLPRRVRGGRAHGRAHARERRRAGRRSTAYGPRAESPSCDADALERERRAPRRRSAPSPSACPVPMSCIAVTTVARPSEPTRTHAYEGGPPPPYQIWLASPTPRFHVPVGARAHLVPPLPVRLRAAVALHQVLGRRTAGRPRGRRRRGCCAAARAGRGRASAASSSSRHSSAERALDEAGRAEGGASAACSASRRTRSCARSGRRRASASGPAVRRRASRPQPTALTKSPPSAVSVPSARAPATSRWIVALRLPASRFSSRAIGEQRTGRPVRFASSAATYVCSRGAVLRAEAAAHEVADDAHLVRGQAERLGDVGADAPDELRRDVDVERVALPAADGAVRLHAVVQRDVCVRYSASTTASASARPRSKSPRS